MESIWCILNEEEVDAFLVNAVSPKVDGLEFIDVPLEVLLESLTPDSLGELRLGYLGYEENVHNHSKLGGKDCLF